MNHFVQQALVFIGSAVVLVPIFHRLGFGSVLGYLIAGMLVGPYGLKFIQDAESIMHFAELGVVLLLFIIGLEIQPRKLWSMRHKLFGLGVLQMLLCTLVFTALAWGAGLDLMASTIIGFGLSLSSTAFAIQTLNEKNQFSTEFGQASFSILLMQDLLAIPALAIIPALGSNLDRPSLSLIHLGAFLLIVLALAAISRFLIRPLFRMIANMHSREIFTAMTLFIVFGVATLMLNIGLSAALGTFIAGVLLADSEYRHELEANLEPFKSLLMGLFFIGVGMSVSLDLLMERPIFIIGMAVAYLAVKMALVYITGRIARMNHENSKLMALNIGQGGEFAFVLFGLALTFRLAPDHTLSVLGAIITLSMAINPLIILANERMTQRCRPLNPEVQYDEIKDESPEVIVAGFGRFGQIFTRMLRAQNIPFVAMDHDADQIELARRFGNKVYYGDVSREDLLEAAGAAKAKYFILAIDDVELSLKTAAILREKFPHLKIFARARNRGHAFDLMELGIIHVKRELIDSSIAFVGELLMEMGWEEEKAITLTRKFKEHDEIMLQDQFNVRNDDKIFVSVSQQGQLQLAEVLKSENSTTFIRPEAPVLVEKVTKN